MIWEEDFWAEEVFVTLENLLPVAAIAALIGAIIYLWKRGPGWLIHKGFNWMTPIGEKWEEKRNGDT